MATLLLQTAGSTIGSAIGGSAGATLGRAAGSIVGQALMQSLNGSGRAVEGPQLETLAMLASNEGAPVPRLTFAADWGLGDGVPDPAPGAARAARKQPPKCRKSNAPPKVEIRTIGVKSYET